MSFFLLLNTKEDFLRDVGWLLCLTDCKVFLIKI